MRFFAHHNDIMRHHRGEIAAAVMTVWNRGNIPETLNAIIPALQAVYSGEKSANPPAFMVALRVAVLARATRTTGESAAMQAIERAEAASKSAVLQRYPALATLSLGADDLLLAGRTGERLRDETRKSLADLRNGESGSFLDRVRSRLSRVEVERLKELSIDLDPTRLGPRSALAPMLLGAAEIRQSGMPELIDPARRSRAGEGVAPSAAALAREAAALSGFLSEEDRGRLRRIIMLTGKDIELSVDMRDDEEQDVSLSWMMRA